MSATRPVTQLLQAWRQGDTGARDELVALVYDRLREIAGKQLRSEGKSPTMQPTALVHEAYIRLAGADVEWQDRVHFYALAARTMRRVLVDHAKGLKRFKRGRGFERISVEDVELISPQRMPDILELDEALERFAAIDLRKSQIIELLYFGGLTYEEAAAALEISPATLHRDLKLARAWLLRELRHEERGRQAPADWERDS
jgi:RNA polymerase sigma factor (TIGR02999 family)